MKELIPEEVIEQKIFMLRNHKIMLSPHLAQLYGVQIKALIQVVKRNIERFPGDFMFQLSEEELEILKSQIMTSRWGGVRRAKLYAFTEQDVAIYRNPGHIRGNTPTYGSARRTKTQNRISYRLTIIASRNQSNPPVH